MKESYNKKASLLKRAGRVINSIINGLEDIEISKRRELMEKSGEACAIAGSLKIAERIAEETSEVQEVIEKVNEQISWCGKWTLNGNEIYSKCFQCGCPLIRNNIIKLNGTFCYCSVGWVKKIFGTMLKCPIKVELEKSIGAGDDYCNFKIYF